MAMVTRFVGSRFEQIEMDYSFYDERTGDVNSLDPKSNNLQEIEIIDYLVSILFQVIKQSS